MPIIAGQTNNLQMAGPLMQVKLGLPPQLEEKLRADGEEFAPPVDITAMIDTGATSSLLQEGIAKQLGLNPIGDAEISTPTSNQHKCYKYQVRIIFMNGMTAILNVVEAPLQNQHIQCLIGRDLLSRSIFVYSGVTNSFTLSF